MHLIFGKIKRYSPVKLLLMDGVLFVVRAVYYNLGVATEE
jgi:hypothetical protein